MKVVALTPVAPASAGLPAVRPSRAANGLAPMQRVHATELHAQGAVRHVHAIEQVVQTTGWRERAIERRVQATRRR